MATAANSPGRWAAGWRAPGPNCSTMPTCWSRFRCTGRGSRAAASTRPRHWPRREAFGRAGRNRTVVRVKPTPPQVGLTRRLRAKNIQGAFEVPAARRIEAEGRKIVLVDDVMTSGATLNAAARVLLRAGAQTRRRAGFRARCYRIVKVSIARRASAELEGPHAEDRDLHHGDLSLLHARQGAADGKGRRRSRKSRWISTRRAAPR